jgi:hypothetical protein
MAHEREASSLDEDRPGSQGDVDPGSEGDFTGPPPTHMDDDEAGNADTDIEDGEQGE